MRAVATLRCRRFITLDLDLDLGDLRRYPGHALPRRIRIGHQSLGVTAPDWIPARIIPPRNLRSPKASRSCSAPEPHEWTVRRRSILETGSSGRSFRSM